MPYKSNNDCDRWLEHNVVHASYNILRIIFLRLVWNEKKKKTISNIIIN